MMRWLHMNQSKTLQASGFLSLSKKKHAWDLMISALQDNVSWAYIKPLRHSSYGRSALLALHYLYLILNVDNMSSKALQKLETISYKGEN